MKLRLPADKEKFKFLFDKLQNYEGLIELRKIQRPRTIKQNKYLHVLITLFGIETGYTIDEIKTLLKRNCDLMRYTKKNEVFLKRTRDLNVHELATFITWIRNYAGINNIYLPSSEDYKRNWDAIERTIESNKAYL